MFINPKTVLKEGWITLPAWMTAEQRDKCIQPNALDFTLDALYQVDATSSAHVTESSKQMRTLQQLSPDLDKKWAIESNQLYDGMSDFFVKVPDDVVSWLVIRSTFNRIGLQLTSGLYDSSFEGNIGFALYNRSGRIITEPHTRIGQIVFVHADAAGKYAGGYNTKEGQHWSQVQGN